MNFKEEEDKNKIEEICFVFRPVRVYRSIEYRLFPRRHRLFHQEHVLHDNDHLP